MAFEAPSRRQRRWSLTAIPLELLAAALHWGGLWALLILAWAFSA